MKMFRGIVFALLVLLTILILSACASKDVVEIDDGIIPETWDTRTSLDGKRRINSPMVFSLTKPEAGNYPESLYKYPFRMGVAWFDDTVEFTQTIDWFPEIKKTFDVDTQYMAVIRLDPKNPGSRTFKTLPQANVSGLPHSSDVDSITAKIVGESLLIYITFKKTGSAKVPGKLVFFDEFNGTTLDKTKWDYSPLPEMGWIRHGRSAWNNRPNLVEVKNGSLFLNFFRDREFGQANASVTPWGREGQRFDWWPEDSGRVLTRQLLVDNWISAGAIRSMKQNYTERMFEHGYGWYEARIKFPKVRGTMGAFWLMSMTFGGPGNKGQYGTEIDILESIGNGHGTWDFAIHWGIPGGHESYLKDFEQPNTLRNGQNLDIYDGEFHVFALDWSPGEYVFYIDGIETGRVPDNGGPEFNNARVNRNPNYIKLSMESAFWDAPLPAGFTSGAIEVDYIRVYNQPQK